MPFTEILRVDLIEDSTDGLWELVKPFPYEAVEANTRIFVPAGFRTNFCSVPRVPGVYLMLGNRARRAGAVHDFLYQTMYMNDRKMCDRMLWEMVQLCGVSRYEADAFYAAVRIGGGSHWGSS